MGMDEMQRGFIVVLENIENMLTDVELKSPRLDIITSNRLRGYINKIKKEISDDLDNQTETAQ